MKDITKQTLAQRSKGHKVKKFINKIVKVLAFLSLVVFATYGLRSMFDNMQQGLSDALTAGIVLGLVYIIFEEYLKD